MKFEASIRDLPERHVACIRHTGPYPKVSEAIEKLFAWAAPRGLIRFPETAVLAVYYDNPDEVDPSQLRSDACISVPVGTPVDGEIKEMRIPGGTFAVAHVEIDGSEYAEAWDKLIGEWIPSSGYEADDSPGRLCYELYLNDPDQHPEKKHVVDICEPVRHNR